MVLYMRKFVRQYPGEFAFREQTQQATRDGNRSVRRVASGGKRVGLLAVDQVDLRHRQACARRQIAHNAQQCGSLALVDLERAIHHQDDAVGCPLGD
jgi:hypothetical protein